MRTPMTNDLIPTSRDLVRLTREKWGLNKAKFGEKIGLTGEFAGRVEHGQQVFSDRNIASGCTHPDPEVRAFWLDYLAAREREQQAAIIEKCFEQNPGQQTIVA